MTDRFSIAMCTYNGARYLEQQLASIAAQTRLPNELVVCDDCSEDETRAIIERFAASAPFPVNFQINERRLGSTSNFEKAITLCQGDIIALSDQDDVWMAEKVSRIYECFQQRPEVGLVFTDAEIVNEDLKPLGYNLWESVGFDSTQRRLVQKGRVLDVLLPGWTVTGATMAFRGRFKNLIADIPTDLPLIHDGWISLLIASVAEVFFLEEPLIKYRQHPQQQIGVRQNKPADDQGTGKVNDAIRRTNPYEAMILIATRAQQRLSEFNAVYACEQPLALLEARIVHLRARASLPPQRLGRLGSVLRELLSRRYHLFSNGVYSAVKDLIA